MTDLRVIHLSIQSMCNSHTNNLLKLEFINFPSVECSTSHLRSSRHCEEECLVLNNSDQNRKNTEFLLLSKSQIWLWEHRFALNCQTLRHLLTKLSLCAVKWQDHTVSHARHSCFNSWSLTSVRAGSLSCSWSEGCCSIISMSHTAYRLFIRVTGEGK